MALSKSTDGGKTFKAIADSVHVDYHAIWIAPNDPTRIIDGEDGGYALTLDGGDNWFFSANLPIAQVYRVGLSNENPYWVCGGLQDNNGWCAPNNSQDPSGIQNKAWIGVAGGDGEWTVPDPVDPNYIWADSENGAVTVINKSRKTAGSSSRICKRRSKASIRARRKCAGTGNRRSRLRRGTATSAGSAATCSSRRRIAACTGR